MKNLRTSINTGIRSSIAGGLAQLLILVSQQKQRMMTQDGKIIALNRYGKTTVMQRPDPMIPSKPGAQDTQAMDNDLSLGA